MSVLYVGGIGRSGSTLLGRALGACPGLTAAGEMMHLLGRGMARNEECSCGHPVRSCDMWGEVIRRVEVGGLWTSPDRIDRLRLRWTEGRSLLAPHLWPKGRALTSFLPRYRELLGRVYRAVRDVTGCRVVVDSSKSPSYLRMLLGVPGVEVSVVHLVRDSRGVVFSLGKRKTRPGTAGNGEELDRRRPPVASLIWLVANLLTEGLRSRVQSYVRVRYSDFVRDPGSVVRRALALTGSECSERFAAHVGHGRVDLGVQHVLCGNPVRAATGRIDLVEDLEWRDHLSPAARHLVTGLTFPLLLRYGYSLAGPKTGLKRPRPSLGTPVQQPQGEIEA